MTAPADLARLNALLIELGRSLLQYAQDAWPWTSSQTGDELRTLIGQLAARQRQSVQALADLLDAEGWSVTFGTYPAEFTSLHYVSLQYLLQQLIDRERALVQECRSAAAAIDPQSDAAGLLPEILAREESILAELEAHRSR